MVPSGHQTLLEQLAHLKTIPDQTLHSVRGDLPAVVDQLCVVHAVCECITAFFTWTCGGR